MVTIKDVARYAEVNPSTVSRVLADSPSISQQTKDKVRAAMTALNYVPNMAAKMLASQTVQAIGVVLPPLKQKEKVAQPFAMEMLTVINNEARKRDLIVSIATGETTRELMEQVRLMFRQKRVNGFIVMYSEKDDAVCQFLVENNVPFVVVGEKIGVPEGVTAINNNNRLMTQDVVAYLHQKGHERLLFVSDDLDSMVCTQRYLGYQDGAKALQLPIEDLALFDVSQAGTVQDVVDTILTHRITAVIVVDDMLALRLMQLLSFYQLSVPDDVSIVSFNNTLYTTILHPYLTSVDINIEQLAMQSLDSLLKRIDGEHVAETIIIPYQLVTRESVISR